MIFKEGNEPMGAKSKRKVGETNLKEDGSNKDKSQVKGGRSPSKSASYI
jgi:hypothetical protein